MLNLKKIIAIGLAVLFILTSCTDNKDVYVKSDEFDFSLLSGWEFVFSTGVGGWATVVQIAPDGTFSGSFHDSEMGLAEEEYPDGTVYVCEFTGEFKPAKKISDYEYSMMCENLTQDGIEGEEIIIDGIRYVTATPYGFDDAGEFRLYLPGINVSELPTEYVEFIYGLEGSQVLECYGLYNIGGAQGFSSYNLEDDSDWGNDEVKDITEVPENSRDDKTIFINGIDVSSEFQVIELDNLPFAEAEAFIQSFAEPGMTESMRCFNYEYAADHDYISDIISDYDYEKGPYVREELEPFLNMDAVVVSSYFTENPIFILFIDSPEALEYSSETERFEIFAIDEVPRIVDGKVYIPMEMFADIAGCTIEID